MDRDVDGQKVDAEYIVLLAMANEIIRMTRNPGRNDECPCGSGLKYKKCHMAKDEAGEPGDELKSEEE